jgi:membrane protein YdbS with pleckstrin-like domain
VDDAVRQPLDPRVRSLWHLMSALAALPVAVVLGGVAIERLLSDAVPLGATLALAAVAVLVAAIVVPIVRYARWSWGLTDEGLELASGVLVRTESAIPFFRVQQVDVRQGPIERLYGLVTLTITTASAGSDGTIPGIDVARADEVRRLILVRVAADDGV